MTVSISIIIPIYNAGKYIAESIDSVLSQTLKNIEIICVDDCSTDDSIDIVESYDDDRICLFTMDENSGAGPARNRGMREAKGEFVAFLDPDDLFADAGCLNKLYEAAKSNSAKICGGNLLEFYDEDASSAVDWGKASFVDNREYRYREYPFSIGYYRFIYDREFLVENDFFFPPLRRYQDPVWFASVMTKAEIFYGMNLPVYLYRKNHQRINFTSEKIDHVLNGMSQNLKLFRDENLKSHYAYEQNELKNFVYKMVYRYPKFSTFKLIKKYNIDFEIQDLFQFFKIGLILIKNKISFYYKKLK